MKSKRTPAFRAAIAGKIVTDDFGTAHHGLHYKQALRTVVDDVGTEGRYRRCTECTRWQEEETSFSPMSRNEDGTVKRFYVVCRACMAARARARAKADPEAYRALRREEYRLNMLDEEKRRKRREEENERRRRFRRENPEKARAMDRAKNKRLYAKLRQNPEKYREFRDKQKIDYYIRKAQKNGGEIEMPQRDPQANRRSHGEVFTNKNKIPSRPLLEALDRILAREQPSDQESFVAARFGTSTRRLYEWRRGRETGVSLLLVDKILTESGLMWWEVWDEKEFPEVAAIFEG